MFNKDLPLDTYLWLAETQRRIDTVLLDEAAAFSRTNFRFPVSVYLVTRAYGQQIFNPAQLREFVSKPFSVTSGDVFSAVSVIERLSFIEAEDNEWPLDRVAKSKGFAAKVIEAALERVASDL